MTPAQLEEIKAAALAADQGGQHIYTNPRDSNNWSNNETWHAAASPALILSLIAQVEALTVPQGWKLVPLEPDQSMCEQGYYEFDPDGQPDAANMWRAMIRAAPTIPAIPGTKEGA